MFKFMDNDNFTPNIFVYLDLRGFFSMTTVHNPNLLVTFTLACSYVVGFHLNHLNDTLPMNTTKCFQEDYERLLTFP